jgi:ribosome-associated translation inhibitor RaiA
MPDGVMQWFDTTARAGVVLRGGRRYPVRAADAEPDAQVAGARIHFDVQRAGGVERAVDVALRAGTRVSHRQRRFGDLSGARSPDMAAAEQWGTLLDEGDLDGAMLLVAPDAALHAGGTALVGPRHIRSHLEGWPPAGAGRCRLIPGDDGTMTVRWPTPEEGARSFDCVLQIAHGLITEMRFAEVATSPSPAPGPPIELSTRGDVGETERSYALEKMERVIGEIERPVLAASLRLERASDPARERPALARITIDLDGDVVRAHVDAHDMTEAVDLLERRARDRLTHVASHQRALRRRGPAEPAGEWRHGSPPDARLPYHPRPVDEREIVRHKTFTTAEATIDEAVFDLESMDYDFLLFTELGSGLDALVERAENGRYGVAFAGSPVPTEAPSSAAAVSFVPDPAPVLSLTEARGNLDTTDDRRVFFTDSTSGRGHVLYRRLDGHYGLLYPAEEPDRPATEHP